MCSEKIKIRFGIDWVKGVVEMYNLLLIEDEKAIQKILYEPLVHAGYNVTTASDGLEGINAFHAEHFDLCLLDMLKIPECLFRKLIFRICLLPFIEQTNQGAKLLVEVVWDYTLLKQSLICMV